MSGRRVLLGYLPGLFLVVACGGKATTVEGDQAANRDGVGSVSSGNGGSGDSSSNDTSDSGSTTDASSSTGRTTGAGGSGGDVADGVGGTSNSTGRPALGCPDEHDGQGSLLVSTDDDHNYTFSSDLSFPVAEVAPDTNLSFNWGGLTHDLLGHPVNPATDISALHMILWTLSADEFEQKQNDDTFTSGDLAVLTSLYSDGAETSGNLFEFTSAGVPLSPDQLLPFVNAREYPPQSNTYTVMAETGDELGGGVRMIQAFRLDPNSANTEVVINDESTVFDYSVDLESLVPTAIPTGTADIVLDWSGVLFTAMGGDFAPADITRIVIAHYDQTLSELEQDFPHLIEYNGDVIADEVWSAGVPSGSRMRLALLTGDGEFGGIDGSGTWLLGLFCDACRNPAPWYLTVLAPCLDQ